MKALDENSSPDFFNTPGFKGNLYQLNEPVLDIHSLLKNLTKKWQHRIICTSSAHEFIKEKNGLIKGVSYDTFNIHAKKIILSGGEGNEKLLLKLGVDSPKMQRRPLQMVLMKSKNLPNLYAHCIGASTKPIATITTHTHSDGDSIWYIGGNIAEEGVNKTADSLIVQTQRTLKTLLPWLDISNAQWTTHRVNRAEPTHKNLLRPDTAFLADVNNIAITWPTKLALTPNLTDQVLRTLEEQYIGPANSQYAQQDTELANVNQQHPLLFSPSLWDRSFHAKN
jgi:glycine/D-amino acid oxidase-like deaminating enzyme